MSPEASARDRERVAALLGRAPRGTFEVAVRDDEGDPVVIRNAPLLDDGTPMPTRFWLVGRDERRRVDRLESEGGVRDAEAAVDPDALAAAHQAYAAERDAAVPTSWDGPRPTGGVGGTRRGVKCLHAHYAWHLAGGDDPVGRWVAAQLQPPVAAIDCGTNSTRLLVADHTGATLTRLMRITRLGEGVDATRQLAPAAIDRTITVLADYRRVMDDFGVRRTRMTATSAARDATNRDDFFTAAHNVIGVTPELLAGEEEGRFSFIGATAGLDPETAPWLVADIGGGSTELIVGRPHQAPDAVRSLDIGCVRITERFLPDDPPSPSQVDDARRYVAGLLAATDPAFTTGRTLVGLAGSVSALARIDQQLETYDRDKVHHHLLTRQTVERLLASLAGEPAAARRRRPGMEAERADVIVGGAIVLAELMCHFDFAVCLHSESDILDGLVSTLLAQ